jgi:vitamin B12 transporter
MVLCACATVAAEGEEDKRIVEKEDASVGSEWTGQMTITANRLDTPRIKTGTSTTTVTAAEIERRGYKSVTEALRAVPGLDVKVSGGEGRQASVFLRGANSAHTKVFIDGIEISDAASPARAVDFGRLDIEDIEKIEVIRGPQSVLYGSDAIGGVINIITRRGKGPVKGYVKAEAGSYGTFRESTGISGSINWFDFRLTATRTDIEGFSAAAWRYGNHEKDGFHRTTVSGKIGIQPCDSVDVTGVFKFTGYNSKVDDWGGWMGDDADRSQEGEELIFRPQVRLTLLEKKWEQILGFSFAKLVRDHQDVDPLALWTSFGPSMYRYISRLYKFDWQHNLKLHETNTLTFGAEMLRERSSGWWSSWNWNTFTMQPPTSLDRNARSACGVYIQDQVSLWERIFVTAGVRIDNHEYFPTAVTWRVAPALWIPETRTRFKGSIGTGFKAPSLYQLHSPDYGNPNLDAEKSFGWDVGVEQYLFDKQLVVGVTWFENTFENLIDWVLINPFLFTGQYRNVGEAFSHGLEVEVAWEPVKQLRIEGSYTYTKARDLIAGQDLQSRPRHKCGMHVLVRPCEKLQIDLGCSVVGRRRENFGPDDFFNSTYMLWDMTCTYDVTDNVQVFASWKNMFDESYEDTHGYGTAGSSIYGGVKISIP